MDLLLTTLAALKSIDRHKTSDDRYYAQARYPSIPVYLRGDAAEQRQRYDSNYVGGRFEEGRRRRPDRGQQHDQQRQYGYPSGDPVPYRPRSEPRYQPATPSSEIVLFHSHFDIEFKQERVFRRIRSAASSTAAAADAGG